MHEIEPYFKWRDEYISSEDKKSPFYGQTYSEFQFSTRVYNYLIHPQWDEFGSNTLYIKVIFVDYDHGFAFIELIGEWNDCLGNDIMYLKREIIDKMINYGIYKYVIACDNVLNFHASDDAYYEEWWDDIKEEGGWVCLLDTFDHVKTEMDQVNLNFYINYGPSFNDLEWRKTTPLVAKTLVEQQLTSVTKGLH